MSETPKPLLAQFTFTVQNSRRETVRQQLAHAMTEDSVAERNNGHTLLLKLFPTAKDIKCVVFKNPEHR